MFSLEIYTCVPCLMDSHSINDEQRVNNHLELEELSYFSKSRADNMPIMLNAIKVPFCVALLV